MAISLKGQNSPGLFALMAANLAVFYGVVQHGAFLRAIGPKRRSRSETSSLPESESR
jgi:hypothetical protein